ncbi:hypothetical protein THTE_4021 [Thermogutta terrifontis]|uniref:Uncharacterized protein n=1 Tax=Thermogutta terrifontis TaxID=1331910 RepID=A0A286RL00_9BACT|nr:hypothetical protein THTE_4021 [Thermogutta terrifontis]
MLFCGGFDGLQSRWNVSQSFAKMDSSEDRFWPPQANEKFVTHCRGTKVSR